MRRSATAFALRSRGFALLFATVTASGVLGAQEPVLLRDLSFDDIAVNPKLTKADFSRSPPALR